MKTKENKSTENVKNLNPNSDCKPQIPLEDIILNLGFWFTQLMEVAPQIARSKMNPNGEVSQSVTDKE